MDDVSSGGFLEKDFSVLSPFSSFLEKSGPKSLTTNAGGTKASDEPFLCHIIVAEAFIFFIINA
jgi:hypothetical protein